MTLFLSLFFFFFFNDTATTEIYTLSLHDALPIYGASDALGQVVNNNLESGGRVVHRSEEHTSELQSRPHLVCRLLLEKKKKNTDYPVNRACRLYSVHYRCLDMSFLCS